MAKNLCWCGETATIRCQDCGSSVCREHSKKVNDAGRIKIFCDHCAGNAEHYGVKVSDNN